jgi:hypothetical protein
MATSRRSVLSAFAVLVLCGWHVAHAQPAAGGGDDTLDLTMTLLPENATGPEPITRRIELPSAAAGAGQPNAPAVPPGEAVPPAAAGEGSSTAEQARERGREFGQDVAEQAREIRENAGRGNAPESPGPPDLPEPPGPPNDPPGPPQP